MLNVKHRKVKREVEKMLIPALAGVLIGEGLSRVQQRETCPKFVKERIDSLTSPLNETPLAKNYPWSFPSHSSFSFEFIHYWKGPQGSCQFH